MCPVAAQPKHSTGMGPGLAPGLGLSAWALAWGAMAMLDGHVDLANLALLMVLGGAVAALWLPAAPSLVLGALSVLAFNWWFVSPRGTLVVDDPQNLLLLVAMWLVHAVVALLMARLRAQASLARAHQQRAEQLRRFGDALRDTADPLAHAGTLQVELASLASVALLASLASRAVPSAAGASSGGGAALLLRRDGQGAPQAATVMALGDTDADEAAMLWHGLRQGQAMGPGTGHHGHLSAWVLPLRGGPAGTAAAVTGQDPGAACLGAALLRLPAAGRDDPPLRLQAQALCDQMGQALQRAYSQAAERDAQAQAQLQAVRNALLAAISHDYRTPLATILGAASSLASQGERLKPAQRQRLAEQIVQEVGHLGRLTDNTLQLARLDAPGVQLRLDWESAEDIVGTVMHRARSRSAATVGPQAASQVGPHAAPAGVLQAAAPVIQPANSAKRLRARLEPGLPLLRCDALLLTQLLDNLVDNALKHTPPDTPVELLVRRSATGVVLAVRDRGPGVPPAWRERIFDVFQRGADLAVPNSDPASAHTRAGAGVGLAVCRAIARAHGGELRCRARGHGGASFECHLPLADPPPGLPPGLPLGPPQGAAEGPAP